MNLPPLDDPRWCDVSVPIEHILTHASLLALGLFLLPLVLFGILHGPSALVGSLSEVDIVASLLIVLGAIVGHEALHAIGWKFFGRLPWSALRFGVDWKTLSPYCHAKAPMRVSAYRIGAILPGLLIGFLPLMLSLVTGNAPWVLFGAFMTSAAVGDLYVLWIIRHLSPNAWVIDHDSHAGCYVFQEDL